jgi:PAS domain S-box-containing protein
MPSPKHKRWIRIGRPQHAPGDQAFRLMFEGHSAIMLLIDPQTSVILDANQSAVNYYGYSKSTLCGMSIHEIMTLPPEQVAEERKKALNQQRSYFIFPHRLASGEVRIVEDHSTPITLKKKQILFSIIHDITQRIQAEEGLKATEEHYRSMLNASPDIITLTDLNGRILMASPAGLKIFGYEREDEMIGHQITDFIAPEDRARASSNVALMFQGIMTGPGEYRGLRPDGNTFNMEVNGEFIRDTDGQPTRMVFIVRNTNERKLADEALLEAEWKFQALFENGPIGVAYHRMIYDALGKPIDYYFIDANSQYIELTGVNPIGKTVTQAFPGIEHDPFDWIGTFGHVAQTGETIHVEQHLQLNQRWYDCVGYQYKPDHFVAAFLEITTHKQAEMALRENEAKQSAMIANIADVIAIIDENGINRYKSPNIEKWFGWRPEDVIGGSTWESIHPDDLGHTQKFFSDLLKKQDATGTMECRYRCKDGTYKWIELTAVNLLHRADIAGMLLNYHDISERKKAEKTLYETEGRYHSLFDRMLDGVYRSTHAGKFVDVNPVMVKMFGYSSRAEMLEMDIKTELYFAPEERGTHKIDTGLGEIDVYRLRRKDGSEIWVEDRGTYIYDEQGCITYHEGIMRDVTQRVQAEEALRKNEAMLNKVQKVAHMGSWEIDLITKTVIASEEAHRVYGMGQGAMTLAAVQSVPLPEFRPVLDAALAALISARKPYDVEFKIKRLNDGEIRDIHSIAEYSAASHTIIGSVQDITERKRTEESIHRRVMELETINRISLAMRGASKQEDMLSIILDEILATLNTAHGSIELFNPMSKNVKKTVVRGWMTQVTEPAVNRADELTSKVLTGGEIYISREFACDPRIRAEARAQIPPGWGGVSLPIRTTQHPLGVLTVCVPSDHELDKDEIRLLSILSEMTGAALQRMQLHTETARRAEEFEALYETSKAISNKNELNTLLQSIVEHAQALLQSASAAIYLYIAESDELVLTVDTASYLPLGTHLQKGEGVAGRVAQTRQPIRIDDYSTWEGRSPQYVENFIRAVLEVPMLYGGELIGVLTVDETGDSRRIFTEADERLLSLFASQTAGALHSSRLHEETIHRLEHLQALRAVDQAISSSDDLRQTLNTLLTHTISQLKVDAADVLLLQPGSKVMNLTAGRGFHTLLFESIDLSDSFAGRAIREQHSILSLHVDDAMLREYPELGKLWQEEGFVCGWCVPLIVKGEVKGVLEVYRRTAYTPDTEWIEFLAALAGQAAIAIDSNQLFDGLQRANLGLRQAYDATIEGWSRAMDLRDHETEGHTLRVTDLSMGLARAMRLDESQLTAIRYGALLHDIGKMGIPDSILLKEGSLTDVEWVHMRHHPQFAHDMLAPIAYLNDSQDIPYCHHEKWDGSGYPRGLSGDQIPLFARIFAVVDVWDALTSDRPYRKKWSDQKTRQYIQEQSGTHFDPQIVDIFLSYIGRETTRFGEY